MRVSTVGLRADVLIQVSPGTITAVTAHKNDPGDAREDVAGYDVSVKIGNVLYVVRYTTLNGANSVEYSPGIEMLFSVGNDKLTFNSKLSGTTQATILRREVLPRQEWTRLVKGPQSVLRHETAASF